MLQAQDPPTGDEQPRAGETEMFCSICRAEMWSSTTGLRRETVSRDLLGPSRPADQRAAAAGTFWARIRDASMRSDATAKTGCCSVAGLCLHLNQCTKQDQTSRCLCVTKHFTLGVLRASCDPPQPMREQQACCPSPGDMLQAQRWRMVPGVVPCIQGAVPGANFHQEHAQASLEKSKLGQCSRGASCGPTPPLAPWPDAVSLGRYGEHALSPWVAPFGCPCLAFLIFKIRVSHFDIFCGVLSSCAGI